MMEMKYWQCPNNEKHPLKWKFRGLRCSEMVCTLCGCDAVFQLKPTRAGLQT